MFGYLRPRLKNEPEQYKKEFKSVYCGVCHTLKKVFGFGSIIALNYDVTAFLLLEMGLKNRQYEIYNRMCVASPIVTVPCINCTDNDIVAAAAVSVYSVGYKIEDNLKDEPNFLWRAAYALYDGFQSKAGDLIGTYKSYIDHVMYKYYNMEKEESSSFEELVSINGEIISSLAMSLTCDLSDEVLKDFKELTHLVGMWIYLVDAFDDYNDDCRNNCFNPINALSDFIYAEKFLNNLADDIENRVDSLHFYSYDYIIRRIFIYNIRLVNTSVLLKLKKG